MWPVTSTEPKPEFEVSLSVSGHKVFAWTGSHGLFTFNPEGEVKHTNDRV